MCFQQKINPAFFSSGQFASRTIKFRDLRVFIQINASYLAERRNYKNVFDALLRITKEEGLLTLWRGAIPTMGRAMVVNAAQLASYSQAKQALLDTGKTIEKFTYKSICE